MPKQNAFEDSAKTLIKESQSKVKANPKFHELTQKRALAGKISPPKVPPIKIKKK
jgi:hypothetical protein